jgi:endonuclease/exonuclease/phosphatase family metal-dependent hydrolase
VRGHHIEVRLRVMCFNVRGSFRDQGTPNAWPARAALNVETIGRRSPDVIGFQELQAGNLVTYRETLPRYDHVLGPRYGNEARPSYNAIFFDSGRLRLLEAGGFWLSETPESYSSSWESRTVRSASWAYLESFDTGLSFLHLNTHLDHLSSPARREGSRLILRKIADLLRRRGGDTPVVVTGDFNCRPGTPAYRNFVQGGFVDTYLAAGDAGGENPYTYHAFEGAHYRDARPGLGPRRIDWILLRDPRGRLHPVSHTIVRDHAGETYPSDHYPVFTDLVPGETRRGSSVSELPLR